MTGLEPRAPRRRRGLGALPRLDRSRPPAAALDPELPAIVLWVTQYPLLHGCVGVFRSLGRAGVPVDAVVASPAEPAARSRYVRHTVTWRPEEGQDVLLERLLEHGRRIGRRSLVVCTADDMAVLVARHRDRLAPAFVVPDVPAALPEELADKHRLHDLCLAHAIPTPASQLVATRSELDRAAASLGFPVAVKSTRLRDQPVAQSVATTTVVSSAEALRDLARSWVEPYDTILQEYLPDECSEDWIVHGYCGTDGAPTVLFTGRKVRSWPPRRGATSEAYVAANEELRTLAARLCASVGYRGVFDTDWRLDRRSGRYHLLDFNPRVGAQFRMFEDDAGIDVVRAMHLDLSGRAVPRGSVEEGERFVVEPWDLASRLADRGAPRVSGGTGRPRLAWASADDPRPAVAALGRQLRASIALRLRRSRTRS